MSSLSLQMKHVRAQRWREDAEMKGEKRQKLKCSVEKYSNMKDEIEKYEENMQNKVVR